MFSFQFNGEDIFHWYDREGNEEILQIPDSLCNQKSNVLRTDHAQIRDKSRLPISKLSYGPHQLETEKMTITVSKLVCQQDHLENFETIEDQISETNAMITDLKEKVEEDDIEIRNLVESQQDTFENHINVFNDLQEKVVDQGLKDSELEDTLHDLKDDHEEKYTDLKKLIKEQSDVNAAQNVTFDNQITQFNSLKEKVEDFAEEYSKINDTIMEHTEMKMQEHMDNGHPYHGMYLI